MLDEPRWLSARALDPLYLWEPPLKASRSPPVLRETSRLPTRSAPVAAGLLPAVVVRLPLYELMDGRLSMPDARARSTLGLVGRCVPVPARAPVPLVPTPRVLDRLPPCRSIC